LDAVTLSRAGWIIGLKKQPDGIWTWISGRPQDSTPGETIWHSGHPTDGDNNCAMITLSITGGVFESYDVKERACSMTAHFICLAV